MASCSSAPIAELSQHLYKTAVNPTATSPPASIFSSYPIPPLPATFRSSPHPTSALSTADREIREFARHPTSQIDALPPHGLGSQSCPWERTKGTAFSGAYEDLEGAPEDLGASPWWNPELETLHALRSSASSEASSSTPFSFGSASTSKIMYSSTIPDEDEAASISSTPPTSAPSAAAGSLSNALSSVTPDQTGEHVPLSLTLFPPTHAAWDVDKLFSRRRRWFGGVRVPSESFLEEPGSEEGFANAVGGEGTEGKEVFSTARILMERQGREERERSAEKRAAGGGLRNVAGSGLCQEYGVEMGGQIAGEQEEDEEEGRMKERQVQVCEAMRELAVERLKLVAAHLEWRST